MLILRFVQLIGMLLVIEGLYLGIVKHSMNLEMIFVGVGVCVFYGSRWLDRKRD
ncbi:MAG: hypothetical protein GY941_04670 [Planctomycetes bacterium]|nr:hypothetical protein [Planctomycetota bacterium]